MSTTETLIRHKAAIPVNGVSFHPDTVRRLREGQQVRLTPEPSNPSDPNALSVNLMTGEQVGYVPASLAYRIVSDPEHPHAAWLGRIISLHIHEDETVGAELVIEAIVPTSSRLSARATR